MCENLCAKHNVFSNYSPGKNYYYMYKIYYLCIKYNIVCGLVKYSIFNLIICKILIANKFNSKI